MKLWKRASAAIKDRKSLLAIGFSRRSSYLEASIIHATSHDESSVDYSNAHRVYKYVRASPLNLKPLLHALSSRVNRTRSWIVTLKSLMLLHGIICCKVPAVIAEIRRLPFDLSDFTDGHLNATNSWGLDAFVRSYFAFLHHYSPFLSDQIFRHRGNRRFLTVNKPDSLIQELDRIQKLQSLLDMLLQIRPMADNMKRTLILEAMDCIVIESINIYGRICSNVSKLIIKIGPEIGKTEATMALKIVNKTISQGEDLTLYFEFCKDFGVSNARQIPQFVKISYEVVEEIEKIVNDVKEESKKVKKTEKETEKAIVVHETPLKLQTIITEKWEIFEDDFDFKEKIVKESDQDRKEEDDDEDKNSLPLIVLDQPDYVNYTMPDLITF